MTRKAKETLPEVLNQGGLHYVPENELGVVFLFAEYARRHRIQIDRIQPGFPDCIAYQETGGRRKRYRIEFEFKSRSFKTHGHSAKKCDWIVCWEHNWPGAPSSLRVVELRREFGFGFNVWIQPVTGEYKADISRTRNSPLWSLPSRASRGDLVLFYHTKPDMCLKDIFRVDGPVKHVKAGWKPGKDYMGPIKLVCRLKAPIFLDELRRHRILKTAGFVRGQMQGRPKATEFWPELYNRIIRKNPPAKRVLKGFDPSRV